MKTYEIKKTPENWYDIRDNDGMTHGLFQSRKAAEEWLEHIEENERNQRRDMALALVED